ncbi:hypothetical protein XBKQ1_80010 [Xenorhabdus bovienii str. kraussei Quebec]|uniref:Uncharacterized protein n=2 Tax=Xenorhabdus bovienii TaxID=40576 RepID=A0A077PLF1_XENBV|nr:hypothetical protein XBKQ1_80010 [Xenorhabdus bovienii str. kraussei Quebec]CDH32937.1 hypothetical protein XBI1_2280086 [Xenorhabdus bovienii str. Intermedium]
MGITPNNFKLGQSEEYKIGLMNVQISCGWWRYPQHHPLGFPI